MKNARFTKPRFYSKKPKVRSHPAQVSQSAYALYQEGKIVLFGSHPVEAALKNPKRKILRLLATENAARRLSEALSERQITPELTTPRELDHMLGSETVHQGLLLETQSLPEPNLEDLTRQILTSGPLLVLDQVTDPHNVGAILRSAAAFGSAGLLMTRRHSPPLNGVLAKSASGALEHIPIALVQNLARSMSELKDMGVEILGLDSTAHSIIEEETFQKPTALVLGAEGKGLRQLTSETCNKIVKIHTSNILHSLNVSNAAAISLHTALLKRMASRG